MEARPHTIPQSVMNRLHERDSGAVIVAAVATWLWILGAFALAALAGPVGWLVAFVVVGVKQHELSVWVHEGSHGHVAKARRLNDALTNWLFAGPVGITVASYRSRHQDHHDHLGTAQDSERHPRTCIRGGRLWGELGRALSGLFAYRLLFAYNDDKHRDPAGMAVAVATQGIIAVACWFFGHWLMYPVLWAAPLLTIAVTLTAFRAIAEHQPRSLDSTPGAEEPIGAWTRSIDSNPVERWLLAPLGFNRHLEHEVFPGVPFYRLEDAHQALAASGGLDEADRWHRGSYVSLLRSLSRG